MKAFLDWPPPDPFRPWGLLATTPNGTDYFFVLFSSSRASPMLETSDIAWQVHWNTLRRAQKWDFALICALVCSGMTLAIGEIFRPSKRTFFCGLGESWWIRCPLMCLHLHQTHHLRHFWTWMPFDFGYLLLRPTTTILLHYELWAEGKQYLFHKTGGRNVPDLIRVVQKVGITGVTASGHVEEILDHFVDGVHHRFHIADLVAGSESSIDNHSGFFDYSFRRLWYLWRTFLTSHNIDSFG